MKRKLTIKEIIDTLREEARIDLCADLYETNLNQECHVGITLTVEELKFLIRKLQRRTP